VLKKAGNANVKSADFQNKKMHFVPASNNHLSANQQNSESVK
jgi:hypothetical protein